jgi:hypothetical protein
MLCGHWSKLIPAKKRLHCAICDFRRIWLRDHLQSSVFAAPSDRKGGKKVSKRQDHMWFLSEKRHDLLPVQLQKRLFCLRQNTFFIKKLKKRWFFRKKICIIML